MRIVFAGTPEFAAKALLALIKTSHNIVAVYTQPDKPAGRGRHLQTSPVKLLAQEQGIPVEQPPKLSPTECQEILHNYQPDVMIVAAYGLLLPPSILAIPKYGCINIHASLLPRWRGASPIQQAILAGDAQTGITLMRMDSGLDTGNILSQHVCALDPKETSLSLHDKLANLGAQAITADLNAIYNIAGELQDNSQTTHAPKISKEQALMDWNKPAEIIEREVRAFNPWPVSYFEINGERVRVWEASVKPAAADNQKIGAVLEVSPEGILIKTAKDNLLITIAQLPGKKAMPVSEIIKSHKDLFTIK